jgi:hypothetical protein
MGCAAGMPHRVVGFCCPVRVHAMCTVTWLQQQGVGHRASCAWVLAGLAGYQQYIHALLAEAVSA